MRVNYVLYNSSAARQARAEAATAVLRRAQRSKASASRSCSSLDSLPSLESVEDSDSSDDSDSESSDSERDSYDVLLNFADFVDKISGVPETGTAPNSPMPYAAPRNNLSETNTEHASIGDRASLTSLRKYKPTTFAEELVNKCEQAGIMVSVNDHR